MLVVLLHIIWTWTEKWRAWLRWIILIVIPALVILFAWNPVKNQYAIQHHPPPEIAQQPEPKVVTNIVEVVKQDPKALAAMDMLLDNQKMLMSLMTANSASPDPIIVTRIIEVQKDIDGLRASDQTNNIESWAANYSRKQKSADEARQIQFDKDLLATRDEFNSHLAFMEMTLGILTNLCQQLASKADDGIKFDFNGFPLPQQPGSVRVNLAQIDFTNHPAWNVRIIWENSHIRTTGGIRAFIPSDGPDDFNFSTNSAQAILEYRNKIENSLHDPFGKVYAEFLRTNQPVNNVSQK